MSAVRFLGFSHGRHYAATRASGDVAVSVGGTFEVEDAGAFVAEFAGCGPDGGPAFEVVEDSAPKRAPKPKR
jgi:hypothetical protein